MDSIQIIILILGIIGTIAFSISGALTSIEKHLDLFGVCILGVITSCGGGVLRDTMLHKEIVMFTEWWYPLISLCTSLLVFLFMFKLRNFEWENSKIYQTTYNLVDSLGLGAFVVVGANSAMNTGIINWFPIIFYAVLTAVGGGLLRDIFVCKIPDIFRKHIYAVASIIVAAYHYILIQAGCIYAINVTSTVLLIVIIRYLAYHYKLSLPKIKLKDDKN